MRLLSSSRNRGGAAGFVKTPAARKSTYYNILLVFLSRARFRHRGVGLGNQRIRQSVTGSGLELVFERPGDYVILAGHERFKPIFGYFGRIVLFTCAELGIVGSGAVEEVSFGGAGHQGGDCDASIFQLLADAL